MVVRAIGWRRHYSAPISVCSCQWATSLASNYKQSSGSECLARYEKICHYGEVSEIARLKPVKRYTPCQAQQSYLINHYFRVFSDRLINIGNHRVTTLWYNRFVWTDLWLIGSSRSKSGFSSKTALPTGWQIVLGWWYLFSAVLTNKSRW